MLDRSVTPGRSPSSSVLSAGCCQWQPTAATPAKSNPPKYRKNSHTLRLLLLLSLTLSGQLSLLGRLQRREILHQEPVSEDISSPYFSEKSPFYCTI